MYNPNLAGRLWNTLYKPQQILLPRVSRVAAYGVDLGADVVALAVQLYPTAARAVGEYVSAGGAGGLITHKQHVVSSITQHGLQIIYHPAAGAHTRTCDHHAGAVGFGQVVHRIEVVFVGVDNGELLERKRVAAGFDQGSRFIVPEGFEIAVDFGEFGGQGGVDYDFEVVPGKVGVCRWQKGGV